MSQSDSFEKAGLKGVDLQRPADLAQILVSYGDTTNLAKVEELLQSNFSVLQIVERGESLLVLEFIEDDEIVIVANEEKLVSLDPPVLRVDFGGEPGSATLIGYRGVRTGPRTTTMLKIVD